MSEVRLLMHQFIDGEWVPVTPQDLGGPWINVKDFGATGDGITNDTTAIQNAITSAASSLITRTVYFPPGIYKCNLTVPKTIILRGAGMAYSGINPPNDTVTKLIPAVNGSPVISITALHGQAIFDFDFYGNGAGTSDSAIKVANGSNTYPGMGLFVQRVRITGFSDGIHLNRPNSCTFIDVSVNWVNNCWKGIGLSDTWQLINCHGNFYNNYAIDAEAPRGVKITGGDWGNASAPLIKISGGGALTFMCANVESISASHWFLVDNSNLAIINNHFLGGNTSAAVVRQTSWNAKTTVQGNRWGFANYGSYGAPLVWECNDVTAGPPEFLAQDGVARLCNSDFTSTTRAWRPGMVGVLAYSTSSQTIPHATVTTVTYSAEGYDHSQSMNHTTGMFTAPESDYYTMSVQVCLTETNANFSRVVEKIGSGEGAIICNSNNHEQYRFMSGTITRYLAAGQTWGAAIYHTKGSSMTTYATGSGTEVWISIVKK